MYFTEFVNLKKKKFIQLGAANLASGNSILKIEIKNNSLNHPGTYVFPFTGVVSWFSG